MSDDTKDDFIQEILALIDENPRLTVIRLFEQLQILKNKNEALAKMLTDGIPRSPKGYAVYHGIDREDWI